MTLPHPIPFKSIPNLATLQAAYPGLKALFFDMDGTLFNTECYHGEAMLQLGQDYNIRAPHSPEVIHQLLVGKADYLVFDIISAWEGFPSHWTVKDFVDTKNKKLLEILKSIDAKDYFPVALKNLLQEAKIAGLDLALVTSSEKVVTKKLLDLAGLAEFFPLELTRDDCPAHKPDPWPYLEAMRITGRQAHEVIIFEDSEVGLTAAHDSRAHVIKVEWY